MKRITINEQEAGLVYKNNQLVKVIFQGKYWFFSGEKVEIYNIYQQFPKISEGIFENELLKKYLEIIEIADDELVLVSEKNNFKEVLTPGVRSEEHTSELQSRENLVCRL